MARGAEQERSARSEMDIEPDGDGVGAERRVVVVAIADGIITGAELVAGDCPIDGVSVLSAETEIAGDHRFDAESCSPTGEVAARFSLITGLRRRLQCRATEPNGASLRVDQCPVEAKTQAGAQFGGCTRGDGQVLMIWGRGRGDAALADGVEVADLPFEAKDEWSCLKVETGPDVGEQILGRIGERAGSDAPIGIGHAYRPDTTSQVQTKIATGPDI